MARKGITPVVAIILLLLITVALVGFAFGFFQRVFTTSAQQTQTETQRLTETTGQTFRIENAAATSVTIRNTGTSALNTASLSVYVDNVAATCTWSPINITSGSIGSCTLGSSCSGKQLRVVGISAEDTVACK
ncbi:MAG: type IV pilin [Candidatus Aenigmarchaeota archaeon]|nr:type IV pilin [Candidatus Aenigmarchaeota archaeon]